MKTKLNIIPCFLFISFITGSSLFLQSCSPNNDITPVSPGASGNLITVKVKDISHASRAVEGQSGSKHFRIVTNDETQTVLLDTTITGNFTYNFKSHQSALNITATLTSSSSFISALEVDVNGQMHAYHDGSCPGTEYAISDQIVF